MTNNQLTRERLEKILSETQATIMEHNSRCVRGSVEVDARLFESMLKELLVRRKADITPAGYFAFDNDGGFTNHDTAESARNEAQSAIDYFRGDACDGWPDDVSSVCWGVIMQQSTKTDERPVDENDKCSSHIECVCDYVLLPELLEKPE